MTVTENRARAGPLDRASPTSSCSTPTPSRCPTCCAGSRRSTSATTTTRSPSTRPGSSTSSRRRSSGARSGRWPAGRRRSPRSATRQSTTSATGRSWSCASAPDTIKAYYNACLHRGRQLREFPGWTTELRCPFHGYCWNLDGSLKEVPAGWDFPHVYERVDEFFLPEVKVGTWGGFVFVNMDPNCEPLESFVGDLTQALRPLAAREALQAGPRGQDHPHATGRWRRRPSWRPTTSWPPTRSCWPASATPTRSTTCPATSAGPSRRTARPARTSSWEPTQQEMFDAMSDRRLDEPPLVEVPEGMTGPPDRRHRRPRDAAAGHRRRGRRALRRRAGRQLLLHAVPELPSVGRLQPHRLPVPPVPGRARALRDGVHVPGAVARGRGAAAAAPRSRSSPRTTTGPRPRSSASWPGSSTRTPSTCRRCRSACGP